MAVSYNNLWKLLIDKNMNKTELKEAAGISFNVMARMGKNETISFQPVEKASNSLAFSNNLWYNIPGDEKC